MRYLTHVQGFGFAAVQTLGNSRAQRRSVSSEERGQVVGLNTRCSGDQYCGYDGEHLAFAPVFVMGYPAGKAFETVQAATIHGLVKLLTVIQPWVKRTFGRNVIPSYGYGTWIYQ